MTKSNKPQWVSKKYMGDDSHSWAIIDKRYLPRGHKGVVFEYIPECAIFAQGLNSQNKAYHLKRAKESLK